MLLDRFQQNLRPLRLHFLLEAVLNLIRNFLIVHLVAPLRSFIVVF